MLTNAPVPPEGVLSGGPIGLTPHWRPDVTWIGRERLAALLDTAPGVRRRVPMVLGLRELDLLLDDAVRARSSWDEAAARDLARIFVPTRAYRRTLETLERHRFAVVTGPPEMGKTAIARTLGLALRPTAGRCTSASGPSRSGRRSTPTARSSSSPTTPSARPSTGPTPPTAGPADLDRILQRLDERHWLVWTSRPAPLKAGLGRIHREHGVERFPQPAEVHVDAPPSTSRRRR